MSVREDPVASRLDRLRELVKQKPGEPFPQYALAMELRKEGLAEDACRVFEDLLNDHSDYLPTYFQLGQLLLDQGSEVQAAEVLESGLEVARQQRDHRAESELSSLLEMI